MHLTLHWLHRDLRRHTPWLMLWTALVALFTWERVWVRFYPDTLFRELWLQALVLGVAELGILLQMLLEDPVRGARAFWKTRPPGGATVFIGKAVPVVIVSLVVPLAAEAVFVRLVPHSGGFYERLALYMVPPLLAFITGAVALSWRRVMIWLPVVVIALWFGGVSLLAALLTRGTALFMADTFLITGAAMTAAAVCAFTGYVRRNGGPLFVTATIILPLLAAVAVAASGWSLVSAVNRNPAGVEASKVTITWRQNEVPLRRMDAGYGDPVLSLPLTVQGVPGTFALRGRVYDVVISPEGQESFRAAINDYAHIKALLAQPGMSSGIWSVSVNPDEARAIAGKPCTVRGKLALLFAERSPGHIPLSGTHALGKSNRRWTAHSRPDSDGDVWYHVEMTGHSEIAPVQTTVRIDPDTAVLRKTGGTEVLKIKEFLARSDYHMHDHLTLWEGIGLIQSARLDFPDQTEEERRLRFQLAMSEKAREGWEIHFDVLTPAGRLDIPFELHVPAGP
jgi:hypothetical protein